MFYVFIALVAYMAAAINPSIILSKLVLGQDIRNLGSKNAGTTNALRTMGTGMGILVFVLDILKVIVSYFFIVLVAKIFEIPMLDSKSMKTVFLFFVVLGHVFPVYYKFKGGKGVAVFLTAAMLIDFKASIVCIIVGLVMIIITRWVSLGSVVGSLLLVLITLFMNTEFNFLFLLATVTLIVYKHKANIKRIINNSENKIFSKEK